MTDGQADSGAGAQAGADHSGTERAIAGSRRGAVQDAVLDTLRRGLAIGAFPPGQVMSLRKLARELGTSPMPVREALSRLVAAGALEVMPNRTMRVPWPSLERIQELTEIRVPLECMAARRACANVDDAFIKELIQINDRHFEAIRADDRTKRLTTNQEFHFAIYGASRLDILTHLIETLWLQCGPAFYTILSEPDSPWGGTAHFEIIDALSRRDADRAAAALEKDIRTAVQHLLSRRVGTAPGA